MTQQNSTPNELREPSDRDRDQHETRLFEMRKQAGFAADPSQTAEALNEFAYSLAMGSTSNVQLSKHERVALDGHLDEIELHAFQYLPNEFQRPDIIWGFEVMRTQVARWSLPPTDRLDGDQRMNLIDLSGMWRCRLQCAVHVADVLRRVGAAQRRAAAVAKLMEEATSAAPSAQQFD